ncbi:MAG: GAF domain-containing protein [Actinobacteria bacterium]|nr:MAG: GAF domain-containing protein [Actinomycetota bacterium]
MSRVLQEEYMRRRIAFKLAAIWLAVAIPLSAVLLATYYQWHKTHLAVIKEQRIGYATLSGTSFKMLVADLQRRMGLVGLEIVDMGVTDPESSLELRRLAASSPSAHLVFTDGRGRALAANQEGLVGEDFSGHDAFRHASRAADGNGIEGVDTGDDGAVGFHLAKRIDARPPLSAGFMIMLVDVGKLHRSFPAVLAKGGISVIDSEGQVVFQNEDPGFALRRERWGDRFPFVRRAIHGDTATTTDFDFPRGGRRIGAFVPIEPFGWAAGSSVEAESALAPFSRTLMVGIPVAVVLAMLALGVSIMISRTIAGSLGLLVQDAQRIGAGDFEQPVHTEREDEIGDVARSLEGARLSLERYERENARLFERQRQDADLDRALADIYSIIHSTLNFRQILDRVLSAAVPALGCDVGGVNLREDRYWVRVALYGLPKEYLGEKLTDEQNRLAALVAKTREPVVVNDALKDDRIDPGFVRRYGIKSSMVFPLRSRDEVVGVLFFNYHSVRTDFTTAQVDFASKLSHSLSLAFENARIYEAEHDIAQTLQTALLALPERVPGIEFAHAYHSATEAARVGGDFYDLFELEHGLLGITVGDISGHGLDAAVLTSLLRSTIRTRAMEQDKTPRQVIEMANTILFRSSPADVFATVFFGVLDRSDGRLVYSSAGHSTGLCICSGSRVATLEANSPLVGAFADASFRESEHRLGAGDVLFLYTDGLIEARRGGELFGEERLLDLLREDRAQDPADVVRRVVDEVLSFSRRQLSDDLAILVLKRQS